MHKNADPIRRKDIPKIAEALQKQHPRWSEGKVLEVAKAESIRRSMEHRNG